MSFNHQMILLVNLNKTKIHKYRHLERRVPLEAFSYYQQFFALSVAHNNRYTHSMNSLKCGKRAKCRIPSLKVWYSILYGCYTNCCYFTAASSTFLIFRMLLYQ